MKKYLLVVITLTILVFSCGVTEPDDKYWTENRFIYDTSYINTTLCTWIELYADGTTDTINLVGRVSLDYSNFYQSFYSTSYVYGFYDVPDNITIKFDTLTSEFYIPGRHFHVPHVYHVGGIQVSPLPELFLSNDTLETGEMVIREVIYIQKIADTFFINYGDNRITDLNKLSQGFHFLQVYQEKFSTFHRDSNYFPDTLNIFSGTNSVYYINKPNWINFAYLRTANSLSSIDIDNNLERGYLVRSNLNYDELYPGYSELLENRSYSIEIEHQDSIATLEDVEPGEYRWFVVGENPFGFSDTLEIVTTVIDG